MKRVDGNTAAKDDCNRILLIEDDSMCQTLYRRALNDASYSVSAAGSLAEGVQNIRSNPGYNAILLDIHLPDNDSVDALRVLKTEAPYCPIVVLTGDETIEQALRFMSSGADEFLLKSSPIKEITERVSEFLNGAYITKKFQDTSSSHGIICESPQLHQILGKIERLKDVCSPILISGESGTGKEKIAQFIHKTSSRSDGPFIALNCAAIAPNLFEAELFGYKKGAFTDAKKDKKGFFELCDNGTLFLDEIGELPLELQSKLLRVLQENEITPVGSCETIKVNTRVISATNKELNPEMSGEFFRKDLYYRLSVFQFTIPPLRERREDILGLARFFASEYAKTYSKNIKAFSNDLRRSLLNYSWPGNVRELKNSIERSVALSESGQLNPEDFFTKNIEASTDEGRALPSAFLDLPYDQAELEFQESYLKYHLDRCSNNVSEVARVTKKNRMWVYRVTERIKQVNSF